MNKCILPTKKQCIELIAEYRVPSNITSHCVSVAKVAVFLACKFNQAGTKVNTELVEKAALLHDIARICDFETIDYSRFNDPVTDQDKQTWEKLRNKFHSINHESAAYEILKDAFPQLAETIKKHWYMGLLDKENGPQTWEEKLLYYADMRVMHDKIVPLQTRLADGHKRNIHLHGSAEKSRLNTTKVDPLVFELEKQICSKINIEPGIITEDNIRACLSKHENLLLNEPELVKKFNNQQKKSPNF